MILRFPKHDGRSGKLPPLDAHNMSTYDKTRDSKEEKLPKRNKSISEGVEPRDSSSKKMPSDAKRQS